MKSSYHVLDDGKTRTHWRQQGTSRSSSGRAGTPEFRWKCIWQLKCPPKIRHFFWRFTHNSLPLRGNIARRGILLNMRCPVCWRLDGDGGHCFLKCKYIKECWRALNMEDIRIRLCDSPSAKQVAECILSLKEERKILTIGLLWSWWDTRTQSQINVGEARRTTDEVIYRARMINISTESEDTDEVMYISSTRDKCTRYPPYSYYPARRNNT